MVDWLWTFLYSITKTLFRIIDGLVACANILCGIEPITVAGEQTDFMRYVLSSDQISFAFKVAALLGIIVVVFFSIIAILRTIAKDKAEGTPAQIVGKAIKSVLSFLFIPVIMLVVINVGNVFMTAMYDATMQGSATLGDFLFKAFAMESGVSAEEVDAFFEAGKSWTSTSQVWTLMDLGEFEFIFSYIAGFVILSSIGVSMMYFVSRVLSIAILFIAAPFSIGSSVLDDGARFKLWRDQMLIKFLTGYGMMIAINIFAMICLLVMSPDVVFFEKGSLKDFMMKLLLIAGGGVTVKQAMALIGNLVSNGAGSNELRDNAIAGGLGSLISKVPGAGIIGGIGSSIKQEITGKAAQSLLPNWMQRSYNGKGKDGGGDGDEKSGDEKDSDSKNSNSPVTGAVKDVASNAINGIGGGDKDKDSKSNKNDKEAKNKGSNMVSDAINNAGGKNRSGKGDYDDVYD